MPPKRTQSKGKSSSSEQCRLCCQKVTEDRDEVLFCGGKCRGWFHRYCAGISLAQYEAIQAQVRSTDEPALFFCLLCTKHVHREEVKELRSTIAALKKEVDQLRDAVKRCKLTTVQEKSKSYADATLSDIHSTAPSRTKVKIGRAHV